MMQVSRLRPAGIINVSDLPASLPRREVEGFAWSEDGFQVTVTLSLAEPVRKPEVLSCLSACLARCTTLELCWQHALCQQAAAESPYSESVQSGIGVRVK